MVSFDDSLEDWKDVEKDLEKKELGLLLGNGSSRAIWNDFAYTSLYEIACDPKQEDKATNIL